MARDTLQTLMMLRRISVDAARRELAKHEQYEAAVDSHVRACEQAILTSEPTSDDYESRLASFGALHDYVDKLRKRSRLLQEHVPIAQMKTDVARNALSQARLAEKSIHTMSLKRDQAVKLAAERREQQVLDEVGRLHQGISLRHHCDE